VQQWFHSLLHVKTTPAPEETSVMRRFSLISATSLLLLFFHSVDAFQASLQQRRPDETCLHSTPSTSSERPDLVEQSTFIAAVNRVEAEIQKALEQQAQQEGTEAPPPLDNNDDMVYAIGRIFVDLPVDTQPELDLTESVGPMVLVTGVWGRTADISGLQTFDTITKVTVGSTAAELTSSGQDNEVAQSTTSATTFAASCKQTSLEETAAILTAAAQHALQNGKTEIQLEINRLIQGYYAPPSAENGQQQQQ
jgi:hypothetical protein